MDELHDRIQETLATPVSLIPTESTEERAKMLRQLWSMLIVLSFLVFILFVGALSIRSTQANMLSTIEDARVEAVSNVLTSRENGYKNRAKICDLILGQGFALDEFCLDPEITKYYDPTVKPTVGGKSDTRHLMCKQWDKMNQIAVKLGEPDEARPVECNQV